MHAPAPRLERIAVGVDFGDASLTALVWAANVLAPDAELFLVHAIDVTGPSGVAAPPPLPPRAEIDAMRARATERLRGVAESFRGRRVRAEVRADQAAWAIAAAAERWGADLIVVGPHGGETATTRRLGSTAERLVRISAVPVLVAEAPRGAPRRLLVPVDQVDLTPAVLDWARLLARCTGADVVLMHVVEPDAPAADAAREWFAELARELPDTPRADLVVATGSPGEEILTAARNTGADLIVMGRRGRGRSLPAVLGSTVSTVLRGAVCPVLVVVDPRDAILDEWEVEGG